MLRQCTSQKVRGDPFEILQSRSLSLIVKECRTTAKGYSQVGVALKKCISNC